MPIMDIFRGDAFSTMSLSGAFRRVPHRPMMLANMGLFDFVPVRTRSVAFEQTDGVLRLVQSSRIGAPPQERVREPRNIRDFRTSRLAMGDTIYAEELQGVRAFGSETETMQLAAEVLRRYDGPFGIQRDIEQTIEWMRLGAIQGIVLDADGSTVYNWYTEWGSTQAAEIDFELDDSATNVRAKCHAVKRAMMIASRGSWVEGVTQIHALVGDEFYDKLIDHPSVRTTFLNWQAAAELRNNVAFDSFSFGGIIWHNFRGTDDYLSTATAGPQQIGIPSTKAKFFPVGAPGVFQEIYGPAEFSPWVNTLGQRVYGLTIPDRDRGAWERVEAYSYPLVINTNPGMLQRAKMQ